MQIYVSYCQSWPLNFFNWEPLILLPRYTKKMFTSFLVPDKIGVFFVINNWYSACFTLTIMNHWKCWKKCYDVEYPLNFLWEINSIVDTMGFHSRAIPLKLIAQNRSTLNFIHELHPEQILYKKIFLIRSADIFHKKIFWTFFCQIFVQIYRGDPFTFHMLNKDQGSTFYHRQVI